MTSAALRFPSRKTVLAATDMLQALGHSGLSRLMMEMGLPAEAAQGSGLAARTTSLAKYIFDHPEMRTEEGQLVTAVIVEEAGRLYREGVTANITERQREAFQRASAGDGAQGDVANAAWNPPMPDWAQGSGSKPETVTISPIVSPPPRSNRRVFIVHGHDPEMKSAVARFVGAIGLEPIILSEQPNAGKTVIEKFERDADVGFAIILLSPDDDSPSGADGRARQNVILEWGYFIGRLGRAHVCALKRGNVELPSDILGIVWENYDDQGAWKRRLIQELNAAGVVFDQAKALTA